jgi:hypothetical protein
MFPDSWDGFFFMADSEWSALQSSNPYLFHRAKAQRSFLYNCYSKLRKSLFQVVPTLPTNHLDNRPTSQAPNICRHISRTACVLWCGSMTRSHFHSKSLHLPNICGPSEPSAMPCCGIPANKRAATCKTHPTNRVRQRPCQSTNPHSCACLHCRCLRFRAPVHQFRIRYDRARW